MATPETAAPSFDQAFDKAFESSVEESNAAVETPVETPEASETDSAEQQQPEPKEEVPDQATESAEDQLLSAEDQKLTGAAREKALNRAFTQKTQKLAAESKRLARAAALHAALLSKPQETLSALARDLGVNLAPQPAAEVKKSSGETAPAEDFTAELVAQGVDQELAATIVKAADAIAARKIAPIEQQQEFVRQQSANQEAASALTAFYAKTPGAAKYEAEMLKAMAMFEPSPNVTLPQYLDFLYKVVAPVTTAQQTRQTIEQINKSAKAADSADSGVSQGRVTPAAPSDFRKLGIDAALDVAFAASRRGEKWEGE